MKWLTPRIHSCLIFPRVLKQRGCSFVPLAFAQVIPPLEESEKVNREGRLEFLKRYKLHMRIFRRDTEGFIGCISLHHLNWELRSFEIGYWIRSTCAGKGYMTEAVNGITNFAIRAGFTLEGILRSASLGYDGERHDNKVFAKVRGIEF